MHHLLSNIIVYQRIKDDPVLRGLASICKKIEKNGGKAMTGKEKDKLRAKAFDQVHAIMEAGTTYGFEKNLWHGYITFCLMTDENPLALVSEKKGMPEGSASGFALHDFDVLMKLMHYDFSTVEEELGTDCFSVLNSYHSVQKNDRMYYSYISVIVNGLSEKLGNASSADEFKEAVNRFYEEYGVGMFGLNKAFRIRNDIDGTPELVPINNLDAVNYDDLVGYEFQKKQVSDNTLAFIEGKAANNVLLYGDAGTGKSTTVKATLNEFYPRGLRLIEIYKHQFKDLSYVISSIKGRNYKFIIYMDDLSFEEFEIEYKYLKAVIEGGFETKPDNILIYATSNRRHLIKESMSDRADMVHDEDMHHSDTIEEKLSLVDRFGLNVLYTKPSFEEYHEIVRRLAKKYGIDMPDEELIKKANTWSVRKGGRTGRVAQQFINSLNPKL
ncbi:MAG: ATP-binding protein [Clostridium sp.]|nr:ATP-binding protein [Clostridium sp.]